MSARKVPAGLFFLLALFFVRAANAEARTNFVVDIDSTLLYVRNFTEAEAKADGGKFIKDGDGVYRRLVDGAGEFLAALSRMPGARVSIWSTRRADTIESVLKQIDIPGGGNALDLVKRTDGGVYNRDDTADTSAKGQKKFQSLNRWFFGVRKKALSKILKPGDTLERTFLIDDDRSNVARGEEKNFLQVPMAITYLENPSRYVHERLSDPEDPATPGAAKYYYEFLHDRNKLVLALGMIRTALQRAQASGQAPTDELWQMQWHRGSRGYTYNVDETRSFEIYRAGYTGFREVNPQFKLTRFELPPDCKRLLNLLSQRV